MVSCLVYIGAVKDNGIHIVVPAWWQIILSSTLFGQACGCQWILSVFEKRTKKLTVSQFKKKDDSSG